MSSNAQEAPLAASSTGTAIRYTAAVLFGVLPLIVLMVLAIDPGIIAQLSGEQQAC